MFIATNIFNKLAKDDIGKIERFGDSLGDIKVQSYFEKSSDSDDSTKFILGEVDMSKIVKNAELWESFSKLVALLDNVSKTKNDRFIDVRFWIQDLTRDFSLNIGFAINEQVNSAQLLTSLRQKIEREILSKQIKSKTLLWLSYDEVNCSWTIKIV